MNTPADTKNLLLFRKIDKIFSASYDISTLIKKIYQELIRVLDTDNFYIAIYNRAENTIDFKYNIENKKEKGKKSKKFSNDLIGYIINTKKSLRINKSFSKYCKELGIMPDKKGKLAKSWLGVPMICGKNVVGVVCIQDYNREDMYTEYEEMLLSGIASRLAFAIENERLRDKVKILSLTDPLTKIATRHFFDLILDREMRRAIHYSRPLSVFILEIDDFKKIKSKHGAAKASDILSHIAHFIRSHVRDTDFIARFNDDKLVIILPETNNSGAMRVSDRIREDLEKERLPIKGFEKKQMTVSIGIATYPYSAETIIELLQNADKALSQAKLLGKSQIESV